MILTPEMSSGSRKVPRSLAATHPPRLIRRVLSPSSSIAQLLFLFLHLLVLLHYYLMPRFCFCITQLPHSL